MIAAPPTNEKHSDWKQQWRAAITSASALCRALQLDPADPRLDLADQPDFPVRVPLSFVARMRMADPFDPLLRQVLSRQAERLIADNERKDPTGDLQMQQGPGILKKYAGRALLITTGACAVHCRYCFRQNYPYSETSAARDDWAPTVAALADDPSLHELILSGGDPLSLGTDKLERLSDALQQLPGLRRLRIHTRLPVVLPARVDAPLLRWLHSLPWRLNIVLHANHAQELDGEVASAVRGLQQTGAIVLNQAVLLAGVNDSLAAQIGLSEALDTMAVLPYYLHQLDPVAGTQHFAVSDAKALALHNGLKAVLPGYLVPRLVREIPGEANKTWLA